MCHSSKTPVVSPQGDVGSLFLVQARFQRAQLGHTFLIFLEDMLLVGVDGLNRD